MCHIVRSARDSFLIDCRRPSCRRKRCRCGALATTLCDAHTLDRDRCDAPLCDACTIRTARGSYCTRHAASASSAFAVPNGVGPSADDRRMLSWLVEQRA